MNVPYLERIEHDGQLLALILRRHYREEGTHFFTPDDYAQQLGYLRLPRGHIIKPHLHNTMSRTVFHTQEVLVILRGQLRVDFYTQSQEYCESRVMLPFDVVLLISGGHGFKVLEATEMLEIKQGPYLGATDKTSFEEIDPALITVRGESA
jgi:hypothetical protein